MQPLIRLCVASLLASASGLVMPLPTSPLTHRSAASQSLTRRTASLSPLPEGISTYSKTRRGDVQEQIRAASLKALVAAIKDGAPLLEIEFPPLLGGRLAKRSTDDYTNIDVLDANRDWSMEFVCAAPLESLKESLWLVFPDATELGLAKENYPGKKYRTATLTSLAEAAGLLGPKADVVPAFFSGSWFKKELDKVTGGDDERSQVASSDAAPPALVVAVQPGDGGPMEDWLNVELLRTPNSQLCVVNGQLDRVRDGYYNRLIFPKMGAVADRFYNNFQSIYYLKPLRDKGFSGWLYRVYPEPWQVIIQQKEDGESGTLVAELERRPTYREAIDMMKRAGASRLG